jgi:hypothetical protein
VKFRKIVVTLLFGALLLPVAITLAALGQLLGAMGDGVGQTVLRIVALVLGFLWVLDLVALVFAVAVAQLASSEPPSSEES